MEINDPLRGVIPVLLTPLKANKDIDELSLQRLVSHLNSKNVGGFWVLGTGGEDMNLTYRQRLRVAETVVEVNNGVSPLILGAGFYALEDSLNFLKDTSHLEVDAYHIMPYNTLISLDRIEWLYRTLADSATRPIWMYTSANWCRFIPPDFIERLHNHPNIAGIKYSTSNAVHIEKALSYANENFQVISAVVRQFYSSLQLGVLAGTTVEACPYPDQIIDIYEHFIADRFSDALEAQRSLNRLLESVPDTAGKDNFLKVAEAKYILSRKGICQPYVSGCYRELDQNEKTAIDEIISKL